MIKQFKKTYLSLETGVGYFSSIRQSLSVPLNINYTTRLHKKNHLETGIGLTYVLDYRHYGTEQYFSESSIFSFAKIGYKYQSHKNSVFFKANLLGVYGVLINSNSPYYTNDIGPLFFPYLGLSCGYSF